MDQILRTIRESAAAEGVTRVKTVGLVVGRRSGALPDALRFAFEVLTAGDGAEDGASGAGSGDRAGGDETARLFRGARLIIEEPPVRARCRRCGLEYGEDDGDAATNWALLCPRCGAGAPELVSGRELRVEFYEGE
jgi:hydrogenase nickel incorporation protein HypA/HybF